MSRELEAIDEAKTDYDPPPLCCLARRPLCDSLLVFAPAGAIGLVPGVAARPPRASEAGVGANTVVVYFCERDAAEDSPPDVWRIVEAARDDAVVLAAQRARVAFLVASGSD